MSLLHAQSKHAPDRDRLGDGEWSSLWFGGRPSHAVRKRPRRDEWRLQSDFGGSIEAAIAPAEVTSAGARGLAAVTAFGYRPTTYARVDGVVVDGQFQLMALEVIEPRLYFTGDPREAGLSTAQLVTTAWASAATFRISDKRGGANGARIRLAPQKDWEVNQPAELTRILATLEGIQVAFDGAEMGGKTVSLADLIVLGGCAAVEDAARKAGIELTVPFSPGRTDASQAQTDAASFAPLEPVADGFRNYVRAGHESLAAELLVDKANLLGLTAPEMTVLVGGMRAIGVSFGQAGHGLFSERQGVLSNEFFVKLLDMSNQWSKCNTADGVLEGRDRRSGELKLTGTIVDLVFGSNSQLRALAEVYASSDAQRVFVRDFVKAWHKVMSLDRYDL